MMFGSIFGILNLLLLIVPWILGIYALILVIKALKIYINKNSQK